MNSRHRFTSRPGDSSVWISVFITFCVLTSTSGFFLMPRTRASSLVGDKFRATGARQIGNLGLAPFLQNAQAPAYRRGELLVRFRAGA